MVLRYLMLATGLALFAVEVDCVASWRAAFTSIISEAARTTQVDFAGMPDVPGSLPEQEDDAGQKKEAKEKEEQSEKEEKKDKNNPFLGHDSLFDAYAGARSATRFHSASSSIESVVREVLAPPPERA